MTLRSADFESAASASSTIPARGGNIHKKYRTAFAPSATAFAHGPNQLICHHSCFLQEPARIFSTRVLAEGACPTAGAVRQ